MNKISAVFGCLVFVLVFVGCGQQSGKISGQPQLESKIQGSEVWDGEPSADDALPDFFGNQAQWGAFPESMVGVWEASVDKYKWGIKFEPDGSILRLEHIFAGKVKMEEEGIYMEGPDEGTFAVFIMGPCEARYIPETRMIKVKIILDYYIMELPGGELEGRAEDYFEGPVSEDGKTWTVEWREYSWLKGATPPDPNLIEANPVELIFSKLDPAQIKKENQGVQ